MGSILNMDEKMKNDEIIAEKMLNITNILKEHNDGKCLNSVELKEGCDLVGNKLEPLCAAIYIETVRGGFNMYPAVFDSFSKTGKSIKIWTMDMWRDNSIPHLHTVGRKSVIRVM